MENLISPEHKNRLDVEMCNRGICRSRSSAADLVKRGKVTIQGNIATKPSTIVTEKDEIVVNGDMFVSRAGEKLAKALTAFAVNVQNLEVLDIGSSTGGFTECLLNNGTKKVIAVDVGTDQLATSLRDDSRVEIHEDTDIRSFALPSPVDMVVVDVSFISLEHILPKVYEFLKKDGQAVILVKPQFEVGKEIATKYRGVISDPSLHQSVLARIKTEAQKIGFQIVNETTSPIEGEKGNKEFLLHFRKS